MRRSAFALSLLLCVAAPRSSPAQDRGAAALAEAVAGLGVSVRVLMVGAHPDDEDTPLIAWLARGRHADVAYLSLTRGDGGQNLIGNELGEALGVIRTEELLAARRVDGGKQFFTRAYDFGFSKSAEETYRHWPKDSVLGDVIRVVRSFRPHIIVPVFIGTARAGHGHHQVSALLAEEAWELAGDTTRFPAGAFGAPWTPLKFYRDVRFAPDQATLRINVGEYSPLLGRSFAEIAGESRSQHKSQGFGALQRKGAVFAYVRREMTRVNEATSPNAERSMFEGIDTTLARVRAHLPHERQRRVLDSLVAAVAALAEQVDLRRPEAALGPLAPVHRLAWRLQQMSDSARPRAVAGGDAAASLAEFRRRLDRAGGAALGAAVEATVPRREVAVGDTVPVTITVYNRARQPIAVTGWHADGDGIGGRGLGGYPPTPVAPDSSARFVIPAVVGARVSQPWWLVEPRTGDMFTPPVWTAGSAPWPYTQREEPPKGSVTVAVGEARYTLEVPLVRRIADPVRGEIGLPLAVVPAIDVMLDRAVEYAPANTPIDRVVRVHLRSYARASRQATVSLRLPAGLSADAAARAVTLDSAAAARTVEFRVRGRLRPGAHTIAAIVESGGERFTAGSIPVEYEHITPRRIYRDAVLRMEAVDATLPAGVRSVAYVPGVGDNVAPMLEQLGVPVTVVEPAALAGADLSRFTTIVVGTRAYESSPELRAANPRLLEWVRAGGTMVVQYGQYEMQQPGMMPYPITLSRPHARVTLEDAPVRILRPEHPLLTRPNRIAAGDFAGWVQERSLYMPVTFDDRYVPLLSMNDPGEQPNEGAILVAPYGNGTYVYTTLSFFRQLPAGVPGPARLFVNMLGARAAAAANGERAITPAVRP